MTDTLDSTTPSLPMLLDALGVSTDDVAATYRHLSQQMTAEVGSIVARRASGDDVWPIVEFADVEAGSVGSDTVDAIRRRGCAVVRGTFDRAEVEGWDAEIGDYLARNDYNGRYASRHAMSAEDGPPTWGIYWSRPQVLARQHARMMTTRRFLNSFWHASDGSLFDAATDIGYPDRIRRRRPGVRAKGLHPHIDTPSAGGWRVRENQGAFRPVLAGQPDRYDPWDAAHRTAAVVDSPAPSTVFRSFQGWTALSEMQPADGVLHTIPIPAAVAYIVAKGMAGELGLLDGDAEPAPRRARADDLLLPALSPIPPVEPGDTVWWHGDIVHSVADAANDTRWGNLMYIGAAPRCPRNDAYATSLLDRFERGASPVDFPAEDYELDFVGRASVADLDETGRRQFGLDPW